MFLAAVAHKYSFPHTPFHINIPNYGENDGSWLNAFVTMFNVSDVQQDVSEHFGVVSSSITRRLQGRGAYQMTRGTTSSSEADQLIQPSTGNVLPSCYQTGLNYAGNLNTLTNTKMYRYGAFDGAATPTPKVLPQQPQPTSSSSTSSKYQGTADGINIIKSTTSKDYSPQFGAAPKTGNYFQPTNSASSTSTKNEKSTSDTTTSTTTRSGETFTGLTTGADYPSAMKKSDSTASDWLSTPTDEIMGIDVKGMEKDRIIFKKDPTA